MQASFRSLLKLVEVSPIPGKKLLYAREKVKERLLWLARRAVVSTAFFN
ncbi:MAG: hypothetical protein HPY46_04070 [Candidatus Aminicenantes bacterium]|nr:hypothetical protein [Candidatus Aminicenantes bacterium]